jgi:hypothetical protein
MARPKCSRFFLVAGGGVDLPLDGTSIPGLMVLMKLASAEKSSSNPLSFHDGELLRLRYSTSMFPRQFEGRRFAEGGASTRLTFLA